MLTHVDAVVGIVKRRLSVKENEKRAMLSVPLEWINDRDVWLLRLEDGSILILPRQKMIELIKKEMGSGGD